MATTKNLGFVKAIHRGTTAPSNTDMLWYNTNAGVNLHYYYDTSISSWRVLGDTGSVVLRQSPDLASVNNLDLNGYQSFAFTDSVNDLQGILNSGLVGGERVSIAFAVNQTAAHNYAVTGNYAPLYLSNEDDFTFQMARRIDFEYKLNLDRWEEIGRTTIGESELTFPVVKLESTPAYNMTSGGSITGLTTTMKTATTITNRGTATVSLVNGDVIVGVGTIYGIDGFNSSGVRVLSIPCAESNANFPVVVGYNDTEKEYLLISGVKIVTTQNDYFAINEQGWVLYINTSDNSFVYGIKN